MLIRQLVVCMVVLDPMRERVNLGSLTILAVPAPSRFTTDRGPGYTSQRILVSIALPGPELSVDMIPEAIPTTR